MSASRTIKSYSDIISMAREKNLHKKWLAKCKESAEKEVYVYSLLDAETKVIGNEFFLSGKYPHDNKPYFRSWRFDFYLTEGNERRKMLNDNPAQDILWWIAVIGILAVLTVVGFNCVERSKMNADKYEHSKIYKLRVGK